MTEPYFLILLPIIAGLIITIIPDKLKPAKGVIALFVAGITGWYSWVLFNIEPIITRINCFAGNFEEGSLIHSTLKSMENAFLLNIDGLSKLIVLFISIIAILILIYSFKTITKEKKIPQYYPFFLITLGAANGAALANNLFLFIVFWGILAISLYKLIKGYDEESSAAAKKTLVLIGASDGVLIIGIGLIWSISGSVNISDISIPTNSPGCIAAFFALIIGAFTKAGAFPFHTWIPDYTKKAPAASSAYLPASLDKLLGIYFLARICTDMFILNEWLKLILLIIGVSTIIIGVMMALIQHDYKKLLGYHAVSQVGYMILGFGLGSALGIAAGLFHMLNNSIYKSGLFLTAGSVKHRTGKNNLDEVGGLSKAMPLTFIAALVFALSISGIPPLNGFASKWMIYQGIIDFGSGTGIASDLWIVWLSLAVLGSALTLASFLKFLSGIFLGRRKTEFKTLKEVNILMWLPKLILALLCVVFGVFATSYVVPYLFEPIVGNFELLGIWQSSTISLLVLASIATGLIIYLIGNIKNFRIAENFVGGEPLKDKTEFKVTGFYETIKQAKILRPIYLLAEKKWFDIYEIGEKIIIKTNTFLSKTHNGILTNYTIWIFMGLILMLIFLIK